MDWRCQGAGSQQRPTKAMTQRGCLLSFRVMGKGEAQQGFKLNQVVHAAANAVVIAKLGGNHGEKMETGDFSEENVRAIGRANSRYDK